MVRQGNGEWAIGRGDAAADAGHLGLRRFLTKQQAPSPPRRLCQCGCQCCADASADAGASCTRLGRMPACRLTKAAAFHRVPSSGPCRRASGTRDTPLDAPRAAASPDPSASPDAACETSRDVQDTPLNTTVACCRCHRLPCQHTRRTCPAHVTRIACCCTWVLVPASAGDIQSRLSIMQQSR